LQDWEALAEVPVWQPPATTTAAAAADAAGGAEEPYLLAAQVSWRGDGKFFATSCCYQGHVQQQVVVWDREGAARHARCSGEEAAALDGVICWPPNGRHLYAAAAAAAGVAVEEAPSSSASASSAAGSAQKQQQGAQGTKPRVQLFERNGLPHGGFDVQPSSSSSSSDNAYAVAHMAFSPDSEVLAVVLAPASWHARHWRHHTPGDPPHPQFDHSSDSWLVQLWHRSNWHWYQKQQVVCEAPGPAGLMACWAEGPGHVLHLMSSRGEYQAFTFDWQASVSGRGTAAVVDGSRLLLTPLR
jgi:elongator complex protein 1